jgi:uncharacterized protein (TIGR02594 family)
VIHEGDIPWMKIAEREIGVKERAGKAHNSRILQYHAETRLKAKADEVPWCSSFVNWVFARCGIEPTRSAAASSWAKWGQETMAKRGAVVVLGKADPDAAGTGHVGFFDRWDEDLNFFWMLGANQKNSVCIARKPAAMMVAVRWPLIS